MNIYEITYERKDGIYVAHLKARNVRAAQKKFRREYKFDKIIEIIKL